MHVLEIETFKFTFYSSKSAAGKFKFTLCKNCLIKSFLRFKNPFTI